MSTIILFYARNIETFNTTRIASCIRSLSRLAIITEIVIITRIINQNRRTYVNTRDILIRARLKRTIALLQHNISIYVMSCETLDTWTESILRYTAAASKVGVLRTFTFMTTILHRIPIILYKFMFMNHNK